MKHVVLLSLLLTACSKKEPPAASAPPEPAKPAAPKEVEPAGSATSGYRMQKPGDLPCHGPSPAKLDALGIQASIDVPLVHFEDITDKHGPGVYLKEDEPETRLYALRINTAVPEQDSDFAKVKARIEKGAGETKSKLTWIKAEATADGYVLAYREDTEWGDKGVQSEFMVRSLRTIGGKAYVCWNSSAVEASVACAMQSCASMKPL